MYEKTSRQGEGAERVWEAGNPGKEVKGRWQSRLWREKAGGDAAKPAKAETRTE